MSTAEPTPAGTAAHATVIDAERTLEQATSARPHDPPRLAAALEQAVDACRRWPEAASGVLYLPELLGELSEIYEQLDRTEDALDTMRAAAITAGYTGAPDPRCRLAEILLQPAVPSRRSRSSPRWRPRPPTMSHSSALVVGRQARR